MFSRVAVVCRPVLSVIVNTSGLTQVPLVTAVKVPPLIRTGTPDRLTALGTVEATVYGGVPP
jgi:hypothetical protein